MLWGASVCFYASRERFHFGFGSSLLSFAVKYQAFYLIQATTGIIKADLVHVAPNLARTT